MRYTVSMEAIQFKCLQSCCTYIVYSSRCTAARSGRHFSHHTSHRYGFNDILYEHGILFAHIFRSLMAILVGLPKFTFICSGGSVASFGVKTTHDTFWGAFRCGSLLCVCDSRVVRIAFGWRCARVPRGIGEHHKDQAINPYIRSTAHSRPSERTMPSSYVEYAWLVVWCAMIRYPGRNVWAYN